MEKLIQKIKDLSEEYTITLQDEISYLSMLFEKPELLAISDYNSLQHDICKEIWFDIREGKELEVKHLDIVKFSNVKAVIENAEKYSTQRFIELSKKIKENKEIISAINISLQFIERVEKRKSVLEGTDFLYLTSMGLDRESFSCSKRIETSHFIIQNKLLKPIFNQIEKVSSDQYDELILKLITAPNNDVIFFVNDLKRLENSIQKIQTHYYRNNENAFKNRLDKFTFMEVKNLKSATSLILELHYQSFHAQAGRFNQFVIENLNNLTNDLISREFLLQIIEDLTFKFSMDTIIIED